MFVVFSLFICQETASHQALWLAWTHYLEHASLELTKIHLCLLEIGVCATIYTCLELLVSLLLRPESWDDRLVPLHRISFFLTCHNIDGHQK